MNHARIRICISYYLELCPQDRWRSSWAIAAMKYHLPAANLTSTRLLEGARWFERDFGEPCTCLSSCQFGSSLRSEFCFRSRTPYFFRIHQLHQPKKEGEDQDGSFQATIYLVARLLRQWDKRAPCSMVWRVKRSGNCR